MLQQRRDLLLVDNPLCTVLVGSPFFASCTRRQCSHAITVLQFHVPSGCNQQLDGLHESTSLLHFAAINAELPYLLWKSTLAPVSNLGWQLWLEVCRPTHQAGRRNASHQQGTHNMHIVRFDYPVQYINQFAAGSHAVLNAKRLVLMLRYHLQALAQCPPTHRSYNEGFNLQAARHAQEARYNRSDVLIQQRSDCWGVVALL